MQLRYPKGRGYKLTCYNSEWDRCFQQVSLFVLFIIHRKADFADMTILVAGGKIKTAERKDRAREMMDITCGLFRHKNRSYGKRHTVLAKIALLWYLIK